MRDICYNIAYNIIMIEDERVFDKCRVGIVDGLRDVGKRQKEIRWYKFIERIALPIDTITTKCLAKRIGLTDTQIETHVDEGFKFSPNA